MTEYKQGKPCPRGHTLRYKNGGSCVQCVLDRSKHVETDHWTLTRKTIKVPDVNGLFWQAKTVTTITA